MMMGNKDFMKKYQESFDKLSSETVEYIRGIQVVKIFGTRLKSFKALYEAIMDYSRYALDYSISCKLPYVVYQLIFLGLIAIISIPLCFFILEAKNPKFYGSRTYYDILSKWRNHGFVYEDNVGEHEYFITLTLPLTT